MKKIPDVAHIFLSGEYDSLYAFFKKTWETSSKSGAYLFRTYYSRKCASLNEHFFQIALENASADEKDALLKLRRETFLTQSGLFLKAPVLAEYYIQHSCFPPILMCDELLISGRDFAETVGSLYRAIVFEFLLHGSVLTNSEQTLLYSSLLKSIDFYSYTCADMANGAELLLDRSISDRIMPCERKPQKNWHVFLNNISTMLSFSPFTQNTAFTPSFHLRGDFYSALCKRLQSSMRLAQNWSRERWQYRNRPTVIWQKSIEDGYYTVLMQLCIRCSFDTTTERIVLTPYVFWKPLQDEDAEQLYTAVGHTLESYGLSALASILLSRKAYTSTIRAQLLMTISSVLALFVFLKDGTESSEKPFAGIEMSDLEKISECYGTIDSVYAEFAHLADSGDPHSRQLRELLWKQLREYLLAKGQPIAYKDKADVTHGRDYYLVAAVNYLFAQDSEQQKKLQYRRKKQIVFNSQSLFYEDSCYLSAYLNSFPTSYYSLERKLGALLVLLQWGAVSLKIHQHEVRESTDATPLSMRRYSNVCTELYLKVGEDTRTAKAITVSRFLPALIEVEQICLANQLTPQRWVQRFCADMDTQSPETEMQKVYSGFVEPIYNSGFLLSQWEGLDPVWLDCPSSENQIRGIQEWNGKPWASQERDRFDSMTIQDYRQYEREQSEYYLNKARQFFYE